MATENHYSIVRSNRPKIVIRSTVHESLSPVYSPSGGEGGNMVGAIIARETRISVRWGDVVPNTETLAVGSRVKAIIFRELKSTLLRITSAPCRERYYVQIGVHHTSGVFLLDGGANTSLITKEFYDTVCNTLPLTPTRCEVTVANGDTLRALGLATVPCVIDGITYMHVVVVIDGLDGVEDGILGCDFFHAHEGGITYWDGKFLLQRGKHEILAIMERDVQGARLMKSTMLPAGTGVFAEVSVPKGEEEFLFEIKASLMNEGMGATDGLVDKSDPHVFIWNSTDNHMQLPVGTVVGKMTPCVIKKETKPGSSHGRDPAVWNASVKKVEIETVEDCDDDGGDSFVAPDRMPFEGECPIASLIRSSDIIKPEDRNKALRMLYRNKIAWALPGDSLGRTDKCKHHINTDGARPVKQPYRRMPIAKLEKIEDDVLDLLNRGVVIPSSSPWGSPLVIVKKKDGTDRICVDYRMLNAATKKDSYPLPRIDECLDALGGNQWFCTLDLESGYWQIEMDEDSQEKTAFVSSLGLFEFKVMAFGLCNAPATFQKMMDTMLDGLKRKICLVYIDDVIVYGKTLGECVHNLEVVMKRIAGYGLKLKPRKCKLFRHEVEYLGRVVTREGVKADPTKIQVIKDWIIPQTVKDVRSFLGFASYYRDFQPNFALIVYPLNELLKNNTSRSQGGNKVKWTDECQYAFNRVKEMLTSAPVLGYPMPDGRYQLDTDASGYAMAGILSQIQQGTEVVLSYASNGFNLSQKNYCTTKRELLAVVTYMQKFRHFLEGHSNYVVRTDHKALLWLINFKGADAMLIRWMLILQRFNMESHNVEHRPGRLHVNADVLSRIVPIKVRACPFTDCKECTALKKVTTRAQKKLGNEGNMMDFLEIPQSKLEESQCRDKDISRLRKLIAEGSPKPTWKDLEPFSEEMASYMSFYQQMFFKEGVLCIKWNKIKWEAGTLEQHRMLVPPHLRKELFDAFHGKLWTGHYGMDRVGQRMRDQLYWPGMANDIERWIRACAVCLCRKGKTGRGKKPLEKRLHGVKFIRIAMDILGPLPETARGNKYVLVVIDYFTKWTEAFALPNHTAITIANCLAEGWFAIHGPPQALVSDGAPEFVGSILDSLASVYDYDRRKTLPYRPQSNGLVERMNRTIVQQLTCFCAEAPERWDTILPFVMSAYRSGVQKSTGYSPYFMVYGEEMPTPVDLKYGVPRGGMDFPCRVCYVENIRHNLMYAWEFARKKLQVTADHQKKLYDKHARTRKILIGDVVFRYNLPGLLTKLNPSWDGPYIILGKVEGNAFALQTATGTTHIHADFVRPWLDEDGNVTAVNIANNKEFRAQLRKGIEILIITELGEAIPGKDCPDVARAKFDAFSKARKSKPRTIWKPVNLDDYEVIGRPKSITDKM